MHTATKIQVNAKMSLERKPPKSGQPQQLNSVKIMAS